MSDRSRRKSTRCGGRCSRWPRGRRRPTRSGGDPSAAPSGAALPHRWRHPRPARLPPRRRPMTASPQPGLGRRLCRLHLRPVRPRGPRLRGLHPKLLKSDSADDAQVLICAAFLADKKYQKAVDACDTSDSHLPHRQCDPGRLLPQGAGPGRHARRERRAHRAGKPSSGISRTATPAGSPSSVSIRSAGTIDVRRGRPVRTAPESAAPRPRVTCPVTTAGVESSSYGIGQ